MGKERGNPAWFVLPRADERPAFVTLISAFHWGIGESVRTQTNNTRVKELETKHTELSGIRWPRGRRGAQKGIENVHLPSRGTVGRVPPGSLVASAGPPASLSQARKSLGLEEAKRTESGLLTPNHAP